MPGTVIYDTKGEPKFQSLPKSIIINEIGDAHKILKDTKRDIDYVIVRPPVEMTQDPDSLDAMLHHHYEKLRNTGAYLDEVYQFHNGGRVGPGLAALLTRGRSRGITTTMSAQRPAWLSRFCLTEAQRFYAFRLVDKADRMRLGDVIPGMKEAAHPEKFHFHYFDFDLEKPAYFLPAPLDKIHDGAYTDDSLDGIKWV